MMAVETGLRFGLLFLLLAHGAVPRARSTALRPARAALPPPPPLVAPPPAGLELGGSVQLSAAELLAFERNGHCAMRGLLSPSEAALVLDALRLEHTRRASETAAKLRADHGVGYRKCEVPFEQLFNLWTTCPAIRAVVGSERLATTAATLLNCERVRLYQDTLLLKRRGHGPTHWHSDLHMAPLDTNQFVTCWLALTPVPRRGEGGSSLTFASGSHRDCAHLFWADEPTTPVERSRYKLRSHAPHAPGDATWHHGWVLHTAPPNGADADRWALAVTFFADGARTLTAQQRKRMHSEDSPSYQPWLPDLEQRAARERNSGAGVLAAHERLPLVPWAPARAPTPKAVGVGAGGEAGGTRATRRPSRRAPRAATGGAHAS